MKRILSLLLENEPGALSSVVGLFSQRGYNIESLNVAQTEDSSLSRLTLMTNGDDAKVTQIIKHLNSLVDVVKIIDLTDGNHIERELMLIKICAVSEIRDELYRCTQIFRAQIIEVSAELYTVQLVGSSGKLNAFIEAVGQTNIIETVRTGVSGISRGSQVLSL